MHFKPLRAMNASSDFFFPSSYNIYLFRSLPSSALLLIVFVILLLIHGIYISSYMV